METKQGYLLLADISGYTSFIAGTELEHSHEIMTELLELLVGQLTPALTLSKLEGDAVFVYAPIAKFPRGETLIELIEATYAAFRDRREAMHRRTTCTCNACRAIPSLDLKFMLHAGDYIIQNVAGTHEMVGSAVNLVHRLLKNHIAEATGWRAYALFTEQSLAQIGLSLTDAHAQVESYEHLGEVQTQTLDLHERYQALIEARHVFLTAEDADIVDVRDLAAPPAQVWDWLNDPNKRTQWMTDRHWSAGLRPGGRTGVGARNHCAHGKDTTTETITDWRPYDYVSTEQVVNGSTLYETMQLEPLDGGQRTRLHTHLHIPISLPAVLRRQIVKLLVSRLGKYKTPDQFERLARLMTADFSAANTPEPST